MQEPSPTDSDVTSVPNLLSASGPFVPPRDYVFEEEFASEIPRPIPAVLKTGSFRRRQMGSIYTIATLGIMCLLAHSLPFVEDLGHYILPLAYLNWIGVGLLAIAVFRFAQAFLTLGPYKYVRHGSPFVGQVKSLTHVAAGTAEAPQFRIAAEVEFRNPETALNQTLLFPSADSWPVAQTSIYESTLVPGDLVTLVSMPGNFDASAAIYGFLGLNPERELIIRNGRPLTGTSPSTAVMIACLSFLILALVLMAFDVLFFSFPLDNLLNKNPHYFLIFGGGGALLAGMLLALRSRRINVPSRSLWSSVKLYLFIGILGVVGGTLLLCVLNSQLDGGKGTPEPVEIVRYWQKTHNFLIRNYEVEYRPVGGGRSEKQHIRYSQMMQLGEATHGALDVGPGFFGFRWVRGICPAVWEVAEEHPDVAGPIYRLSFKLENPETTEPGAEAIADEMISVDLKPLLMIHSEPPGQGFSSFAELPAPLLKPVVDQLRVKFPDMKLVEPNEKSQPAG